MLSTRLEFDNLPNIRDLGGMVTKDGHRIKSGILFRGGRLCEASENDKEKLAGMLDLVLDFRSEDEVVRHPDPDIPGIKNIHMSIYDNTFRPDKKIEKTAIDPEGKPMHDAERTKRSMCSMYLQFAENDYSKKQYERFLRYLLSDQYHGVLWHCTAGKDRTGVGAAILQKILGVSDEDIFADYMLTNNYMGTEVEQAKAEFKEEWGYLTEENERALEYLHRTHEDYIRTVLTRIDELFGSFENYITEGLHITKEEEELLKQKYLE